MNEDKKIEILAIINRDWDLFPSRIELARDIESKYIFGPYGSSQHYNIDEIENLINQVYLEKNPPENIVEEEINDITQI